MKKELIKVFKDLYQDTLAITPKIIVGLLIIILFVALGKIIFKIFGKLIQKKWKGSIVAGFIAEATKWCIYLFGILIAMNILGFGNLAGGMIAGAGVSAIIIGFAFKDIGENFLAGLLLALNRPFEVGDIIEIGGSKGVVKDLDLRVTHLRSPDGKDTYIPNSSIIKNTLINFTNDGNLRVDFLLRVSRETNIVKTQKLILEHLKKSKYILQTPSFNVIIQEFGEYTTNLQVFFWIDLFKNKDKPDYLLGVNIRSLLITEIKTILDDNGIDMPSQVIEHKMHKNAQPISVTLNK